VSGPFKSIGIWPPEESFENSRPGPTGASLWQPSSLPWIPSLLGPDVGWALLVQRNKEFIEGDTGTISKTLTDALSMLLQSYKQAGGAAPPGEATSEQITSVLGVYPTGVYLEQNSPQPAHQMWLISHAIAWGCVKGSKFFWDYLWAANPGNGTPKFGQAARALRLAGWNVQWGQPAPWGGIVPIPCSYLVATLADHSTMLSPVVSAEWVSGSVGGGLCS